MKPAFLSLAERAFERARDTKPPIFQPWHLRRSYYATRFNIDLKITEKIAELTEFRHRVVNYLKRKFRHVITNNLIAIIITL